MSYQIDVIWKTIKCRWRFVKKRDRGRPRFWDIDIWSWHHKNLFPTSWYLCQNFTCHNVPTVASERFRIITHRLVASFSWKVILCKTNNIFHSLENLIGHNMNSVFSKYIKNKGKVTLDSFLHFACDSSYLRLKRFGWKRDCLILQKVHMSITSSRPI